MQNKFTDAMAVLAAEARREPSWEPYAQWCSARANGLREQAAAIADQFAEAARLWSFEERKRFTLWFVRSTGLAMEKCGASQFETRFSTSGPGLFAPRVVVDVVTRSTVVEWRDAEPSNPEPHFWLGLYDESGWASLQEAIRLDPAHSSTRAAIAMRGLMAVEYDQHELPSGYLGNPADDLIELAIVEELIAGTADPRAHSSMTQKVALLRVDAEEWLRLREQLKGLDWNSRVSLWEARAKPPL